MGIIKKILCCLGIHRYAKWWPPYPGEQVRPNPHCQWCGVNLKEPKYRRKK